MSTREIHGLTLSENNREFMDEVESLRCFCTLDLTDSGLPPRRGVRIGVDSNPGVCCESRRDRARWRAVACVGSGES
eukprot:2278105-Rhodomonas_salina.1